jgi:hypothetical protein
MTSLKRLRQVVTLVALVLALAHVIFPSLAIDAITLGLLVISVIPWIAPLVKSFELPGGWKIELQEMQAATAKVRDAGLLSSGNEQLKAEHTFLQVAEADPNLALAGLRIEIERKLVALCEKHEISVRSRGMGSLLRALSERGVLTNEQRAALSDLSGLLNSAVHGARVDPQTASSVLDIGPDLLESLNRVISADKTKIFVQSDQPRFSKHGDLWIKPSED